MPKYRVEVSWKEHRFVEVEAESEADAEYQVETRDWRLFDVVVSSDDEAKIAWVEEIM